MFRSAAEDSLEIATPKCGTETLLVVEDDPAVRGLTARLLTKNGYTVLEAASGLDALEVRPTMRETVDLVLTDLVMPGGLSGHQLARRLQADRPEIKILFTSGYSSKLLDAPLNCGWAKISSRYRARQTSC